MARFSVSGSDVNCRYFAAPESQHLGTQFGKHLEDIGVRLPSNISLQTLVRRGWFRPRLRVAIPERALRSWSTFPSYPMTGHHACPVEDKWGLDVWLAATCLIPRAERAVEKYWMHWLDDADDTTTSSARKHAVEPTDANGEPQPIQHENGRCILPWIDFYADWQAYHLAELVRLARFTVDGVTTSFEACSEHARNHAQDFDERARKLAQGWEARGLFLDQVAAYRTIMSFCIGRESFKPDLRAGVRSWAAQRGIDGQSVRVGIRDTLLRLWDRWNCESPVSGPSLLRRLQQDIQYATRLLEDLTGDPIDPFDSFWQWPGRDRLEWAQLIDALPYEEWRARQEFPGQSVSYQRSFPSCLQSSDVETAQALTRHWSTCRPLRRFVLAWFRLHRELRGRGKDLPAESTITADELIEQYNLIGLHTERLLRDVGATDTNSPLHKQATSTRVMRDAAQRSLRSIGAAVTVTDQSIDTLLGTRTKLHNMPDLLSQICQPADVASGNNDADHVIAAHVNALIARNYAAHHDYVDHELVYPSSDDSKPHPGFLLVSSCLLVVFAALHAPPSAQS